MHPLVLGGPGTHWSHHLARGCLFASTWFSPINMSMCWRPGGEGGAGTQRAQHCAALEGQWETQAQWIQLTVKYRNIDTHTPPPPAQGAGQGI